MNYDREVIDFIYTYDLFVSADRQLIMGCLLVRVINHVLSIFLRIMVLPFLVMG